MNAITKVNYYLKTEGCDWQGIDKAEAISMIQVAQTTDTYKVEQVGDNQIFSCEDFQILIDMHVEAVRW